jgi:hypothetical protein
LAERRLRRRVLELRPWWSSSWGLLWLVVVAGGASMLWAGGVSICSATCENGLSSAETSSRPIERVEGEKAVSIARMERLFELPTNSHGTADRGKARATYRGPTCSTWNLNTKSLADPGRAEVNWAPRGGRSV